MLEGRKFIFYLAGIVSLRAMRLWVTQCKKEDHQEYALTANKSEAMKDDLLPRRGGIWNGDVY